MEKHRDLRKDFVNCTSECCIEENFNRVLDMYGYEELKEVSVTNDIEEGCVFLENFPAFVIGDTVNVKVDGKEYFLVAYYDGECTIIGDKHSDIEKNLGEHGSWQIDYYDGEAWFYSSYPYTVTYDIHANYHPISKDFLPDGYPYVEYTTDADSYTDVEITKGVEYVCKAVVPRKNFEDEATFFAYIDDKLVHTAPINSHADFQDAILTVFRTGLMCTQTITKPPKTDRKTGKYMLDVSCMPDRSCTLRYGYKYPSSIKPLDYKYLPEGYPYMGEEDITLNYDSSKFTNLTLQGFPSFKVGDTVNIKVDGIGYSLEAFPESMNGFDYIVIGDSFYELENKTGEYGWLVYVPPEEELILFRSSGIHTVSWNVPKAYPIDPKFLPAGIGDVLGVVITADESSTLTCNTTYEEIMEALTNNVLVFATFVKHNSDHFEQRHFGCVRKYLDYSEVIFEGGDQSAVRINSDNNVWIDAPM